MGSAAALDPARPSRVASPIGESGGEEERGGEAVRTALSGHMWPIDEPAREGRRLDIDWCGPVIDLSVTRAEGCC